MKTKLRFFYASVFVVCLFAGVTVVTATRFVFSMIAPTKTPVTEQVIQSVNVDFPPEPSLVDEVPEIFDAAGMYGLSTENIPRAFKDVEMLEIETHEYSEENGSYTAKPIVPNGYLSAGKDFKFKTITIADREVTFETAEISGVSYKFVGHFPLNPQFEYCESCEYPPDLKGKLIKLKHGKLVAETNVDFYIEGC